MGCIACGKPPPSPSTADLRSLLRPPSDIGTYAGFDSARGLLVLGNNQIERRFLLDGDGSSPHTSHYFYKPSGRNYVSLPCGEFRFRVGEIAYSANMEALKYKSHKIRQGRSESKNLTVELEYSEVAGEPICSVKLHYEVYPNLPLIRKWIRFENLTDSAFSVEDVIVESLSLAAASKAQSNVFEIRPESTIDSGPFIVLYATEGDGGIIVGNEAPGILKHFNLQSGGTEIEIGLTPTSAINGVEIHVPPNAVVSTPKVWTMLFEGDYSASSGVRDLIVGQGLVSVDEGIAQTPPITWTKIPTDGKLPDGDFIVVDYDWNGDNLSALRRLARQAHQDARNFGIRLPIAKIDVRFLNRDEWRLSPVASFASLASKNPVTQSPGVPDMKSLNSSGGEEVVYCVLCDYGYYISHAVHVLLEDVKPDLLVFDGAIIGLPDNALKGCAVLRHGHLSRKGSIGSIYRWVFDFADHLRQQYPNLRIGITSTAYGVEIPDLAVYAHFDMFFPERD
ncbi:MAG: hypothetical protein OXN17_09430 [Candidatus Poribacteria bacterium]|nr:hypothetical protein [Candidatus Poribacteria bacterium]MDE0504400.1 hypothetical protein [Candidatus Poribacteria bacterium]